MLKNQLIIELATALKIINDRDEELRIAAAANRTTNKALEEEKKNSARLSKVLDRAITAVDSRIATIRYVPPMVSHSPNPCIRDEGPMIIEEAEPTEEEKFLNFLVIQILHDQYEPKKSSNFDDGFDSLMYGMRR